MDEEEIDRLLAALGLEVPDVADESDDDECLATDWDGIGDWCDD